MSSKDIFSNSLNSDDTREMLRNLISEDSPQFADALTQVRSLREVLQAQGHTVDVGLEELLSRIREFFSSAEYEQHMKQVTTELRSLADHLEQSSGTLEETLEEFIQSFAQRLEGDELKQREQLQRECSAATQVAIAHSLSNIKVTSNNFEDLLADFNKQLEEIQQNLQDQIGS